MSSGGITPLPSAITLIPMVSTRKKVPISSITYLFMAAPNHNLVVNGDTRKLHVHHATTFLRAVSSVLFASLLLCGDFKTKCILCPAAWASARRRAFRERGEPCLCGDKALCLLLGEAGLYQLPSSHAYAVQRSASLLRHLIERTSLDHRQKYPFRYLRDFSDRVDTRHRSL